MSGVARPLGILTAPRRPLVSAERRYRLKLEHEAAAVQFVLDGLGVGSLQELHRLVGLGRVHDGICDECGTIRYAFTDRGPYACVNRSCGRYNHAAFLCRRRDSNGA